MSGLDTVLAVLMIGHSLFGHDGPDMLQDALRAGTGQGTVQAQIINVLKRMCSEHGASVMLITHDMGVIAEATDRVAVMYAGRLAELGTVENVLTHPQHPYTHGLMASTPLASAGKARLHQIPGAMPRLDAVPEGCAFNPRCTRATDRCRQSPGPRIETGSAACWHPLVEEAVS